jgi:hypothetical protein
VYSESASIASQTSVQWDPIGMTSGNAGSGGTIHFDLNKNGFLTRAVLQLDFIRLAGVQTCHPYVNAINEISLSTNGRTISTLNRAGILARLSEKPTEIRDGIGDAIGLATGASATDRPATNPFQFLLELDFMFKQSKYSLMTNFIQPLRVSVSFRNFDDISPTNGSLLIASGSPTIHSLYRNMNEAETTRTVNENYDSGLLSQLIPTMSYENGLKRRLGDTAGDVVTFDVPINDTSCVESCFVYVTIDPEDKDWVTSEAEYKDIGRPLELVGDIQFRSNGTDFFKVPARLLQYYGVPSQLGNAGLGSTKKDDASNGGLQFVYCLAFGTGSVDSQDVSNLISLRELATPTIRVTVKTPMTKKADGSGPVVVYQALMATCYVSWARREIATTTASTGRYQVSLSN